MAEARLPTARVRAAHLERLRSLTEAQGVSGDEGAVRKLVQAAIEGQADTVRTDSMGNLLVTRKGAGQARLRVLCAAHMDEVGLMVTAIDNDGYLRVEAVGGLDVDTLPGKLIWVGADRVAGVIGAKPVHLTKEDEDRRTISIDSIRIDIGAGSKDAAQSRVRVGDRATFATHFERLGRTIRAKALDDRLGVATLIELVLNPPAGIELLAAFTVQEEVGLRGARVAAYSLDPDLALALDCTPARDLPSWDGSENTSYNARLNAGPALYVSDGSTLSDPRLVRHFEETAEEHRIRYQIRQPGGGGTDAGAIHLTREGIPSLSISVPARYLHSPASIASLADWRATVRLVYAGLSRLPGRWKRSR